VRNSGAHAVVEGTGDHCCEYMTGGVAVIIGPTGRNFAAGMSGGVAYVLDEAGDFPSRCNREMVDLEPLVDLDEVELVRDLLIQHAGYTGSTVAARLLSSWDQTIEKFVKIMPLDYRRVLEEQKKAEAQAEARDEAEQVEVARG
jgi:glutamate synthase (ferredoxin)